MNKKSVKLSKTKVEKQTVLMSDMSQCQPGTALSTKIRPRHWQLVTYKTDEVSGTMVLARGVTHVPEIMLPLKLQG